jgi:hypothetical protein
MDSIVDLGFKSGRDAFLARNLIDDYHGTGS